MGEINAQSKQSPSQSTVPIRCGAGGVGESLYEVVKLFYFILSIFSESIHKNAFNENVETGAAV